MSEHNAKYWTYNDMSEEMKQKMSKAKIGKPGVFTGRKHSMETKQKMREAKLGKKLTEEQSGR